MYIAYIREEKITKETPMIVSDRDLSSPSPGLTFSKYTPTTTNRIPATCSLLSFSPYTKVMIIATKAGYEKRRVEDIETAICLYDSNSVREEKLKKIPMRAIFLSSIVEHRKDSFLASNKIAMNITAKMYRYIKTVMEEKPS